MDTHSPDSGNSSALVLVVERDPHVRDLETGGWMEAVGAVQFAADGLRALELARSSAPAIVVTEILVPKMDGLALCRAVKADKRLQHTSVLVFSILAASARAHEAGADAFLLKPLAQSRLVDTVRELLSRRDAATKSSESE